MLVPDGFPGQRLVVVPRPALAVALADPLSGILVPSDAGIFPSARAHGRDRPRGSDELILIACSAGRGWAQVGNRRLSVQAGELLLIAPRVAHVYGADPADPWTISWVHCVGRSLAAWQRRLGPATVRPLVDPAAWNHAHREVLDRLELGHGAAHLLAAAAALWGLLTAVAAPAAPAADPLTRALDVMRARLDGQVTVAELAAAAGWSVAHFATRFRARIGQPPLDHFLRLKMARAATLLAGTTLSVKAVAERLGYADAFYFSRSFRRIHGAGPREFRQGLG
jgi:AraC family transcriptional regulator of arabinose operon